ncbi:hypothetical protein VB712_17710 [Spirulina sp. CCNP1310]|uniref:hypothetical protein n=1 Tax=Spirulina sp. CCNP1310 TaxID=3110249 RepID=UPI002B207309|nr:hypothetical protein [Spirulina sp. CCNP1310]MEA5421066.1 hypothetical protein [Spirulina sp. CCNP1310]
MPVNSQQLAPPTPILLAIATLPFLGGVFAIAAIASSLQTWGEVSTELFRGDRLPVLPFPTRPSLD